MHLLCLYHPSGTQRHVYNPHENERQKYVDMDSKKNREEKCEKKKM